MTEPAGGDTAPRIRVDRRADVPAALDHAGLRRGRPVVVLVGGAGGMGERDLATVAAVLRDEVVPLVGRHDAVVVDGGTDAGVMRLVGRARAASGGRFPLVGVAVARTVVGSGAAAVLPDAAPLEPHHTLFLLVPGSRWGDEVAWIDAVARAVADGRPAVTVLVNGGAIAYDDADATLRSGRPLVVLAGTGRTADAVARAQAGAADDPRAAAIAASPLTRVAAIDDPGAVGAAIEAALGADR